MLMIMLHTLSKVTPAPTPPRPP
eukprot:COSAG02_NODE_5574_length_4220_cov_12.097792_1_plen_22_part_10